MVAQKLVSIAVDGEGEVEFYLDEPMLDILKKDFSYGETGSSCGAAALRAIINRALAKCHFELALEAKALTR